jgi:acetylornithine aminotransferase
VSDFVFEPGSSNGFVRFPPVGLIHTIVALVRERGGTVIANEVTTGTGRTGRWFGYEHYGITPEFIAIGKGIGNGYPVSVAVLRRGMAEQLDESRFVYAQSHQNDPMGARVAREVVDVIAREGLLSRAADNGEWLLGQLQDLVDGTIVKGVRGRGLMLAVDLADTDLTERLHSRLLDFGFIVGHRGWGFRIDPPLTIGEEKLGEFGIAFRQAIREEGGSQ